MIVMTDGESTFRVRDGYTLMGATMGAPLPDRTMDHQQSQCPVGDSGERAAMKPHRFAYRYWSWLKDAAPDDWLQCAVIGHWDTAEMSRQFRALAKSLGFRARYGTQRRETSSTVDIIRKPDTRPSRIAKRTGYRKDSAAHRTARAKVSPERRREIARMGALAANSKRRISSHGS